CGGASQTRNEGRAESCGPPSLADRSVPAAVFGALLDRGVNGSGALAVAPSGSGADLLGRAERIGCRTGSDAGRWRDGRAGGDRRVALPRSEPLKVGRFEIGGELAGEGEGIGGGRLQDE